MQSTPIPAESLVRPKGPSEFARFVPSDGSAHAKPLRSQVPWMAVLKLARTLLSRPDYAKAFTSLQVEKEFFNRLYPEASNGLANKIRQLSFRITDVCNLRCHTCGQWGDNGYLLDAKLADLRKSEVPPARYIELLRDLKQKKHQPVLYFWGGEPMMYKGLLDVIEEGARLGMPPTIATNGTDVADEAVRIVGAPMALVQISVDGSSAATHNVARPGANRKHDNFAAVIRAFERLKEEKLRRKQRLPLVITLTTISRENYKDLVNIYHRFHGLADMHIFYLSWWIDQKSADAYVPHFEARFGQKPALPYGWVGDWNKFDYGELLRELRAVKELSRGLRSTPVYVMPDLNNESDLDRYYSDHDSTFGFTECVSIFQNPEIDSNGNLSPCRDYHDYVVGNVKDHTMTELWNSERYVKFRQSIRTDGLMPVCTRCCGLMGF